MSVTVQVRIKDENLGTLTKLAGEAGVGVRQLVEGIVSLYLQDPSGDRDRRLATAVVAAVREYEGRGGFKAYVEKRMESPEFRREHEAARAELSRKRGRPLSMTEKQIEDAAEMRAAGNSYAHIGTLVGCDRETVRRTLKAKGLA